MEGFQESDQMLFVNYLTLALNFLYPVSIQSTSTLFFCLVFSHPTKEGQCIVLNHSFK